MADPGFRILLISSAAVLVLAVVDVVWLVRTRHASGPGKECPGGARTRGSQAAGPAETDPAGKAAAATAGAGRLARLRRVWRTPRAIAAGVRGAPESCRDL
jgi:hypothetical protein